MIFTIENMPQDLSDGECLVKGFNNETTPIIFEQAVNTNEHRNTFFYFFENLNKDQTFNPSLKEFENKIEFLKKYLKFLKVGQQSNYNFHFKVKLFLNGPKGNDANSHLKAIFDQLTMKDDKHLIFEPKYAIEKNLVFAYIFNVYTFFLGVQKFVFRKADEHMRDYMKNSQFHTDSFEFLLSVFRLGLGRVLKLNLIRESLLGFFVNENLPADFSLGNLSVFKQIYEINFINLMLYKITFRNDNYQNMATSKKMLLIFVNWFKEGNNKVQELMQILPNCHFNWRPDLERFLRRLMLYYQLMFQTFIIRYNFLLEKDKEKCLDSEGKSMGQIHKENHLLASRILEIEKDFSVQEDNFLSKFTQWVYFEKIRDRSELKKSVKLYESLKSEIDKTCKDVNLDSIYSQKEFNDSNIKSQLLEKTAEQLTSFKY